MYHKPFGLVLELRFLQMLGIGCFELADAYHSCFLLITSLKSSNYL